MRWPQITVQFHTTEKPDGFHIPGPSHVLLTVDGEVFVLTADEYRAAVEVWRRFLSAGTRTGD